MRSGFVYIMSNEPNGMLYIGVTANLAARVLQHRSGTGSEFCREHGLTTLVHIEPYPSITEAIAREKALKKWKRAWKLNLIGRSNPDWRDLWIDLNS